MSHRCPVCGYPNLAKPPRSRSGADSHEICPSCGFHFGVSDHDEGFNYDSWRHFWQRGGMCWVSQPQPAPDGWNPKTQIEKLRSTLIHQNVVLLTPINDAAVPVDWAEAQDVEIDPNDLERNPAGAAQFAALPPAAAQAKNYATWQKDFVNAIYGTRKVTLLKSTTYNQVSRIEEGEGDFRVRLSQASREQRDAATAKLRAKYTPKITTLNERLRRAEQAVERDAAQAKQAKLSSVLSIGSTLLGAFLGRKAVSAGNISKAGTAVRSVGRASQQSADVARAGETVEALRQQLAELDAQFQAEARAIESGLDPTSESFETIELRPSKTNISVKLFALAWTPHVRDASGQQVPATEPRNG